MKYKYKKNLYIIFNNLIIIDSACLIKYNIRISWLNSKLREYTFKLNDFFLISFSN
jgi:hypothetical protein